MSLVDEISNVNIQACKRARGLKSAFEMYSSFSGLLSRASSVLFCTLSCASLLAIH